MIHQLNMRASVALMRNSEAERKAKEMAEAPTVKTEEQIRKEEELRAKYGTTPRASHPQKITPLNVWKRKFRPLPEAKAVDLFAEVIGDAFILIIASALVVFEYYRSSSKPDKNSEMIKDLDRRLAELDEREKQLEEAERKQQERVQMIEDALRAYKDPKTKKALLPTPAA